MNSKKSLNQRKLLFLIFFLVLAGFLIYYIHSEHLSIVSEDTNVSDVSLIFSESNSFQNADFQVKIKIKDGISKQGLQIHYTTDGTEPTLSSPIYTTPLYFSVNEEIKPYILKAAVCYHNQLGKVLTKTYFTGNDIDNRFTLPVVSISIDSAQLYDENTGIYTHYSERSEEWIRSAHIEVYDTDGSEMVNQNIGLSISGVTSATYEIKPFKFNAGIEWDSNTKFPNIISQKLPYELSFSPNFEQIDKVNSIKLKNGGSGDYWGSRLREVIGMRLAKEAGFTPITDMYPAVVYLNGTYYDLMQMTATYSANNLSKIFSLNEDQIQIMKDSEKAVVSNFAGKEYLLTADYNDSSVIADFENTFDKDNFFLYYAIEMLIGNTDWPQYNNGCWRYQGKPIAGNPYSDGKIRFLYYDLSSSYRLESEHEIFQDLLDQPIDTKSWLSYVLKNPEYKRYFVNLLCDLMSTTFQPEHITSIIDEEYDRLRSEDIILASIQNGISSELAAEREVSVQTLKDKVNERIWFIRTAMADYMGVDYFNEASRYNLTIASPQEGMVIQYNTHFVFPSDSDYCGLYYVNYPLLLQAVPNDGYIFDYWLINGNKITDSSFFLTPDLISQPDITVEVIGHQTEGTTPIISKISAYGSDDWIEFYNPYSNDIYLGLYSLSNNEEQLYKYSLPKVTLASGESIRIYGAHTSALGCYYMNMNIRKGDTLSLNTQNGEAISTIFIPSMKENCCYQRKDYSKIWTFDTIK